MIDGSTSQHHGVVIGPFGSVPPPLLVAVPEVTAGGVTNNADRETLPHCEGKVHLDRDHRDTKSDRWRRREAKKQGIKKSSNFLKKNITATDLCGGKHGVFIQTEHSISGDGVVGQKATAYHLVCDFKKQRHTNKM